MAAVALVALALAAPANASFTPAQREQLAARVQAMMAAGAYPGMVAGVWAPHGDVWVHAYGLRKITLSVAQPMGVSDRFRVGSITKTMTATVILRLVQLRRLSLNTPLSVFFPGILHAEQITIRQLLNHTSLIPDLDRTTPESLLRVPLQQFDPAEVIGAALTQPFCAAPWCYSDTNYLLLGQIIQRVTGRSVADALSRYVLRPLRLNRTSYFPGTRLSETAAHGYTNQHGQLVDVTHWTTSYAGAAGSVVSTAGDLRRWAAALAKGTLLSPALAHERLQWVKTGHEGFEYGLGLFKLGAFVGHNGLLPGYDSTMLYSPQLQITIVVLGNADPQLYEPGNPANTLQLALEMAQVASGAPAGPPPPGRTAH